MNPLELMVYVYMGLSSLSLQENVTIPDISLNFSDNILGTLNLTDIRVSGFDTMNNSIPFMNATEDADNNNNFRIFLPVGELRFTLNYVADINADEEIPIYGEGAFSFNVTELKLNLSVFINFNERYVDDVVFQSVYRHTPIQLTGFWKHREVSLIAESVLNIVNRLVAMWSTYEPDRASCLTKPFVTYILNDWIGNQNNTFEFDRSCFKDIFFDGNQFNQAKSDNRRSPLILPLFKYLSQIAFGLL